MVLSLPQGSGERETGRENETVNVLTLEGTWHFLILLNGHKSLFIPF